MYSLTFRVCVTTPRIVDEMERRTQQARQFYRRREATTHAKCNYRISVQSNENIACLFQRVTFVSFCICLVSYLRHSAFYATVRSRTGHLTSTRPDRQPATGAGRPDRFPSLTIADDDVCSRQRSAAGAADNLRVAVLSISRGEVRALSGRTLATTRQRWTEVAS